MSASSSRVWPGLLLGARRDDDDVRPLDDREVVAARHARVGELGAVREVEHLGLDLLGGDVVQRDLAAPTRG